MKVLGLQKLTLLDYPEKIAATLFTGGCNFRCPFCHNGDLALASEDSEAIDNDEIFDFLAKRKGLLEGVCITGGEPLIQEDIADFIKKIKDLGFLVKLDTNGAFPHRLLPLIEDGLVDYVAMDIKNTLEKYGFTAGIPGLDAGLIHKSAKILMEGPIPYEFRTTMVKQFHEPQDFVDIASWLKGANKYFLQAFRDGENTLAPGLEPFSKDEALKILEEVRNNFNIVDLRGY